MRMYASLLNFEEELKPRLAGPGMYRTFSETEIRF